MKKLHKSLVQWATPKVLTTFFFGLKAVSPVTRFKFYQISQGEATLGYWKLTLGSVKNKNKKMAFIPGFADTPFSWAGVFALIPRVLFKHYSEIYFLDYPGFSGALHDKNCIPTMDMFFEMTRSLLNNLKVDTVIGHSMGGWAAADFAANSTLVSKLILISPTGLFPTQKDKDLLKFKYFNSIATDANNYKKHIFINEPAWFKAFIPDIGHYIARVDIRSFIDSMGDQHEVDASKITAKTHLIWGEKDDLTLASWIPAWKEKLTSPLSIHLLPKSGHMLHIEDPLVTANTIKKAIEG